MINSDQSDEGGVAGRRPPRTPMKPTRPRSATADKRTGLNAARDAAISNGKKVQRGIDQATAPAATRDRATKGARQAAGAASRGRSTPSRVADTSADVVDRTRDGVGEVAGRAEAASTITRAVTGKVLSAGAELTKGVLATAGSAVRAGATASLSFLIGRALLLLELIRRLVHMALNAFLGWLQRLQEGSRSELPVHTAGS
jgi:hypothetical protein